MPHSMSQSIPHITNQLAQMHIHGGVSQYIVNSAGGFTQQNSWQISHPQPTNQMDGVCKPFNLKFLIILLVHF